MVCYNGISSLQIMFPYLLLSQLKIQIRRGNGKSKKQRHLFVSGAYLGQRLIYLHDLYLKLEIVAVVNSGKLIFIGVMFPFENDRDPYRIVFFGGDIRCWSPLSPLRSIVPFHLRLSILSPPRVRVYA